jgi:predicted RNA binding protein YcfA (HicA-like mRNA interferase family)
MPNGLNNWTGGAVIKFLKGYGFSHDHTRGSHFYYSGKYDGKDRLVTVSMHTRSGVIPLGTMKGIIAQSGIPESIWRGS